MRIAFYILMMFLILVSAVDAISGNSRKNEESILKTLGVKPRKIDSIIVFGISTAVVAVMLTMEMIF